MRRVSALFVLAALTVLAGCGGPDGAGGLPTPADGAPSPSSPTPTVTGGPASSPPSVPTGEATTNTRPLVYVVPGRFAGEPAVQGLVRKYPLYFRALVLRDPRIVAANFPAYFYADTEAQILSAKRKGLVMMPPGSIVVREVERRPFGVVRISSCRSQRTEFWNKSARTWARSAPQGSPDVIEMIRRGDGWTMYRWLRPVPRPFSCAGVRYPA